MLFSLWELNPSCQQVQYSKRKNLSKCGEVGHLATVCKSKPQNLPVNLLQNENPSDDEYCFTINSPLAKTTFTLNNALPVEFPVGAVLLQIVFSISSFCQSFIIGHRDQIFPNWKRSVFSCERFRNYVYGLQFTVVTDHKSLLKGTLMQIWKSPYMFVFV